MVRVNASMPIMRGEENSSKTCLELGDAQNRLDRFVKLFPLKLLIKEGVETNLTYETHSTQYKMCIAQEKLRRVT